MKQKRSRWFAAAAPLTVLFAWAAHAEKPLIVVDDEESVNAIIPLLVSGQGTALLEKDDVYEEDADRRAALRLVGGVGDGQRYNPRIPGWAYAIVANPNGANEIRYLTFAWKKTGGDGIQFQMHRDVGGWGYRYHAGVNERNWFPSILVNDEIPEEWEIHTRDLFDDWGEFTLTGIAFTSWSAESVWDHVVFHQEKADPLDNLSVDPAEKAASVWAELKSR